MTLEEVLQSIYVGKINNEKNNNIYTSLNKDELEIIKEMVLKNSYFEPINALHYEATIDDKEGFKFKNINIDFEENNFKDMLTQILSALELNYTLDFNSFRDVLLFVEILKKYKKRVNLHLFNIRVLSIKEQELLNSLLLETILTFAMQLYVESENTLKTNKTQTGVELIQDVDYKIIEVEPSLDLVKKYKGE